MCIIINTVAAIKKGSIINVVVCKWYTPPKVCLTLGGKSEYPRIFAALVIHYRTVIFFRASARFAPLEIQHAVAAVRHRLHRSQLIHSALFQLVVPFPVFQPGRAFHKQIRRILQRVEKIVPKRRSCRLMQMFGRVPRGIVIERNYVEFGREFVIIQFCITNRGSSGFLYFAISVREK